MFKTELPDDVSAEEDHSEEYVLSTDMVNGKQEKLQKEAIIKLRRCVDTKKVKRKSKVGPKTLYKCDECNMEYSSPGWVLKKLQT